MKDKLEAVVERLKYFNFGIFLGITFFTVIGLLRLALK